MNDRFYWVPWKRRNWSFGLAFGRFEHDWFVQIGPFLIGRDSR